LLSEVASRLDYVLGHDDAYVRAHQGEIGEIRRQLEKKSREQLVAEVGYTWFNRIVALRFMDLRGYTKVRSESASGAGAAGAPLSDQAGSHTSGDPVVAGGL